MSVKSRKGLPARKSQRLRTSLALSLFIASASMFPVTGEAETLAVSINHETKALSGIPGMEAATGLDIKIGGSESQPGILLFDGSPGKKWLLDAKGNQPVSFYALLSGESEVRVHEGVSVEISGNRNSANSGAYWGGTVIEAEADLSVEVKAGGALSFRDNIAEGLNGGGVIYSLFDNIKFVGDNITFSGNRALQNEDWGQGADATGGAIHANTGSVSFSGNTITFHNNFADNDGGGVYADRVDFGGTGLVFTENTAKAGSGGALSAYDRIAFTGEQAVILFSKNKAGGLGGALTAEDVAFDNFRTLVFADNEAGNGGAVATGTSIVFNGGEQAQLLFAGNQSTYYGGALFSAGTVTFETIDDLQFTGNQAGQNGGAINASTLIFRDTAAVFTANQSDFNGGAINAQTLRFAAGADVAFNGNETQTGGGAIVANEIIIEDGAKLAFTGNRVMDGLVYGGGAVHTKTIDARGFTELSFTDNVSTGAGGALFLMGTDDSPSVSRLLADNGDVVFRGNRAGMEKTGNKLSGGHANAVYIAKGEDDTRLLLAAAAGRQILFYDPLSGNSINGAATIDINTDGTVATAGTVTFSGELYEHGSVDTWSDVTAVTTVHGGTLELKDNAVYGVTEPGTSFHLKDGAALRSSGIQEPAENGIVAEKIVLADNSGMEGNGDSSLNLVTASGFVDLEGSIGITVAAENKLVLHAQLTDAAGKTGSVVKTGSGVLVLTGQHEYSGDTELLEGTLLIGTQPGSDAYVKGNVNVTGGAVLGGNGTVKGDVTIGTGGVLSTGASIGTLTVGNIFFDSGATFLVEANGAGDADLLKAIGTADLNGNVEFCVAGSAGQVWEVGRRYTILTADGGINGSFNGVTGDSFLFLTPDVSVDAKQVQLSMVRNQRQFSEFAVTENQRRTAAGLDSLQSGALLNVVANYTQGDQAFLPGVYDSLSGEIHAGVKSAAVTQSRAVRDAVNERLLQTGENSEEVWAKTWRQKSVLDGDGNAAGLKNNTTGMMIGFERPAKGEGRWGVAGALEWGSVLLQGRSGSGNVDAKQLILYRSMKAGDFNLRGAVGYGWLQFDTRRSIAAIGLLGDNKANYHGRLVHSFVEMSRSYDKTLLVWMPYLRLDYLHLNNAAAREDGTASALLIENDSLHSGYSTLGVRGEWQARKNFTVYGSMGWQHAFGSVKPEATLRFNGSQSFVITGARFARDRLLLQAGIAAALNTNTRLHLEYTGAFGDSSKENGVQLQATYNF
ncbi:MAG: autotransporter domain-containing protein [Sporomusaceae bacterium]|nr:autotransporter domain-containing protein [Sporomusaceae bacterium]